jgi:hypothetical protein
VKNIYSLVNAPPRGEPSPQIKVTTRRDVGILEKQVDVPLTAATTVRWMWNVAKLPSDRRGRHGRPRLHQHRRAVL